MPELPEVETTVQGIKLFVEGKTVKKIVIRHHQLRWPVPQHLHQLLAGEKIYTITRRAKYILIHFNLGALIIHLGMSGHLRVLPRYINPQKHDHVDIELNNGKVIRFNDPRRFGALLWAPEDLDNHVILKHLGMEPLERSFSGNYLWKISQSRKAPIKSLIMDQKIVVGVGNIYATEALFLANIHPCSPANTLSEENYISLVKAIKTTLKKAIKNGGTTLKDFLNIEGKPGYFVNQLKAYGRAGLPCLHCGCTLESITIAQRSSVYCPTCQIKQISAN